MKDYPFDIEFQIEVIDYLIKENATEFLSYLDDSVFDSQELKEIFNFIKKYAEKEYNVPQWRTIKELCGGVFTHKDDVLPPVKQKVISVANRDKATHGEYRLDEIRNVLVEFVKAQHSRRIFVNIGGDIDRGNYDVEDWRNQLDKVLHIENIDNYGIRFSKFEIEKEQDPVCIRTPFPTINLWLGGVGLGKGQLGLLMARTNLGKSWFLINLAAHALLFNHNVFYYSFELDEYEVYLRIGSKITEMEAAGIVGNKDSYRAKLHSVIDRKNGEIYIKQYPTRGATVLDINSHIRYVSSTFNTKPDLILIDYADYVKPQHWSDEDHERVRSVIESLRGMAVEHKAAMWTVSQIKQEEYDKETLQLNSGSRSIGKIEVSDFGLGMFTTSKTPEGEAIVKLLKTRKKKPENVTFKVKLDFDIGTIREM